MSTEEFQQNLNLMLTYHDINIFAKNSDAIHPVISIANIFIYLVQANIHMSENIRENILTHPELALIDKILSHLTTFNISLSEQDIEIITDVENIELFNENAWQTIWATLGNQLTKDIFQNILYLYIENDVEGILNLITSTLDNPAVEPSTPALLDFSFFESWTEEETDNESDITESCNIS